MMVDISGFTKITERLARHVDGAERLVEFLNEYFGALVGVVTAHGGDIGRLGSRVCAWELFWAGRMVSQARETRGTHSYSP